MARRHQPVDQRLVLRGEGVIERADVAVPLLLGAGTGNHRRDEGGVQHPGDRELSGGDALLLRVSLDLLREAQRSWPPFGLHHAGVVAACARLLVGGCIRLVLAGEHAARQGAIGHDAETVIGTGGEVLDLRHAVHGVVVRLAHRGSIDAEPVADVADLGDAPGAVVGDAEIAHLARADQVTHRAHRLFQRSRVIFLVQIVDVDVIGAEPLQALVGRLQHPTPRQPAAIGIVAHGIGEFCREHPGVAIAGDGAADNFFGSTFRIGIRRVDEVDPGAVRLADDPF